MTNYVAQSCSKPLSRYIKWRRIVEKFVLWQRTSIDRLRTELKISWYFQKFKISKLSKISWYFWKLEWWVYFLYFDIFQNIIIFQPCIFHNGLVVENSSISNTVVQIRLRYHTTIYMYKLEIFSLSSTINQKWCLLPMAEISRYFRLIGNGQWTKC